MSTLKTSRVQAIIVALVCIASTNEWTLPTLGCECRTCHLGSSLSSSSLSVHQLKHSKFRRVESNQKLHGGLSRQQRSARPFVCTVCRDNMQHRYARIDATPAESSSATGNRNSRLRGRCIRGRAKRTRGMRGQQAAPHRNMSNWQEDRLVRSGPTAECSRPVCQNMSAKCNLRLSTFGPGICFRCLSVGIVLECRQQ